MSLMVQWVKKGIKANRRNEQEQREFTKEVRKEETLEEVELKKTRWWEWNTHSLDLAKHKINILEQLSYEIH